MQGVEVENNLQENKEEKLPYFAEVAISPLFVRLSGLLLFAVFVLSAIAFGIFSFDDFADLISDVKITIPSIIGCYLFRFLIQYIVLKFFSGLANDQVRVGFSDKNLTPFVHSRRPFELGKFRLYLILPFILMSVVPFIFSFFVFGDVLYLIASIAAAFCVNDLISFVRSFNYPGYLLSADHPEKFGFVLYDNPFHEI